MYIAAHYRRTHGLNSTIIATYGQDFVDFLEPHVRMALPPGGQPTLRYHNIVVDGQRTQACEHQRTSVMPVFNDAARQHLRASDIAIVAPALENYPSGAVRSVLENTREHCLKVLLPQGYLRDTSDGTVRRRDFREAAGLLPFFDLVVLSNEDIENAAETTKTWSSNYPEVLFVVTEASGGATLYQASVATHVPTNVIPLEKIVNPVGSGDVFSASLALALHRGLAPVEATKTAHAETAQVLTSAPLNTSKK